MKLTLFLNFLLIFDSTKGIVEGLSEAAEVWLPKILTREIQINFYSSALSKNDLKQMCGRYRRQQGISPYCRKIEQMNRKMRTNLFW